MVPPKLCDGVSCDLNPLTAKPAVTTILLTLGDMANSELVIKGASSQLIAETMIRTSTPVSNPKILIVLDNADGGENLEDRGYIEGILLLRYDTTVITTTSNGLSPDQTEGYDLIWFNNPGHPMGSRNTMATLLAFKGGVIIQGDDMSWGSDNIGYFSLEKLTGLRPIDNGSSVTCSDGNSYDHDNDSGYQYRVSIDPKKIQGADASALNFHYGNDIDNTAVARKDLEVIAVARGGPAVCTETRPVIVRYFKN